jgi:hypothetical protein
MSGVATIKSKPSQARKSKPVQESGVVAESEAATTPLPPKRDSKISKVIALLEREEGATLEELVKATGWLPHTTRAALTGLKKKGHTIERSKRGEISCYCIRASA